MRVFSAIFDYTERLLNREGDLMTDIIISPVSSTPIWVLIVNVLQVLLLLWFGSLILLGSWKL